MSAVTHRMAALQDSEATQGHLSPNMCDIQGSMLHVFEKIETCSRNVIVEEIVEDHGAEIIQETREILAGIAERYFRRSCELAGIKDTEQPAMKIKDRRGDKSVSSKAEDIYDLYCYNSGLYEDFPRGVFTLSKNTDIPTKGLCSHDNQLPGKTFELVLRMNELAARCGQRERGLQDEMKMLKCSYENKISVLEGTITVLQGEMKALRDFITQCELPVLKVGNEQPHREHQGQTSDQQRAPQRVPQGAPQVEEQPAPPGPKSSQDLGQTASSESSNRAQADEATSRSAPPTLTSDNKHGQSLAAHDRTNNNRGDGHPSSKPDSGSNMDHSQRSDAKLYSDTVKEGPWQNVSGRKRAPQRKQPPRGANPNSLLAGAKYEVAEWMYVTNISMSLDDTEEDICRRIKQYAGNEGIRVMSARVIKNRYCDDVVGCKISVPQRQSDSLLYDDFWPSNIGCRKWSGRKQRDNKEWDSSQRRWEDNSWSRDNYEGDSSHRKWATNSRSRQRGGSDDRHREDASYGSWDQE